MFFVLRSPTPGEILVVWQTYKACGSEELTLQEGDVVELLDTVDPAGPTIKRRKLNPELDIEGEAPLDTTAAQHKLSVRPRRTRTSSRHSPSRSNLNARWLVRKMQGDKRQGWVPCQILQSVDEPTPTSGLPGDAAFRRQAVVNELVETEQEFVKDLDFVVQNYLIYPEKDPKKVPKIVRDNFADVFASLKEIAEFHRVVLMEGVRYYAKEPALLGKAFLRLERDFDKHVNYCKEEPIAQVLLDSSDEARDYFEELSHRLSDDKSLAEHLKLPIQRINDYQLLLKELVRYNACLGEDNSDLQKALELMLSVPHRAQDDKFTSSIEGYRGSIHKLGRLLAHDWFSVNFGDLVKERYLFLFRARILICKVRRISEDRSVFQLKDIIRLPQVDVKDHVGDDNTFELIEKTTGQPLILTAHRQNVKQFWLKEIREFAGEIDESSDDLQVTSEPTSPPTESVQFEKEPEKPKELPKTKEIEVKVPKIEEPLHDSAPKAEETKKVEEPPVKVRKIEEKAQVEKEVEKKVEDATKVVVIPKTAVEEKQILEEVNKSKPTQEVKENPKQEESKPAQSKVEAKTVKEKLKDPPSQKEEDDLKIVKPQESEKVGNPGYPKSNPGNPKSNPGNPKSNPGNPEKNPKTESKEAQPKPEAKAVKEAVTDQTTQNPKTTKQGNPNPGNPGGTSEAGNPQGNPKLDNPTEVASVISHKTHITETKSGISSQQVQSVTVEKQTVISKSHADEVEIKKIDIQVDLKTAGLEIDDDMSRRYTEYTSSASARSGGYEDSSYGRRSTSASKSAYSTDGYSSSRRSAESAALSSKYGADSLSSKYGGDSLTGKYGTDTSLTGKYGTETSLTGKYGTDTSLTGKYGTETSLSGKYGTESSLTSKYGSDSLTSKYGNDSLGNKYGLESTRYGVEGNTKYEITSKYNKSDIDGGSKSEMSYTKRSVTDSGDGDAYGSSYTRRSIRAETRIEGDDDRKSRNRQETGGDSYSSYSKRSIKESRIEDDGDYDTRSTRRLKSKPSDDLDEYSYRKSVRSSERSIAGDADGDYTYRKTTKIERIGGEDEHSYKKRSIPAVEDDTDSYISRRRNRKIEVADDDDDIDKYVKEQKDLNEDLDPSAYLSKRRSLKSEDIGGDIQTKKVSRQDSDVADYKRLTSLEEERSSFKVEEKAFSQRVSSSEEEPKPEEKRKKTRRVTSIEEDRTSSQITETRESSAKESTVIQKDDEFVKSVAETAHMEDSIGLTLKAKKDITAPAEERPLFTKTISGQTVEPSEEEVNKPYFAVQLKDTELLEDTYLRFMIKVKGEPHPDVTFYKDGVKISQSDERRRVIKDHENVGFYELVIPEVKPTDAGLYRCVAINAHGEATTEARLTITGTKVVFDETINTSSVLPPGEKAQFSWRKDGRDFDPEERFKVLLGNDEDSLALIFQHVRPEDAGLYTCVAQTSTGHISCSAELTVQGTVVELHREPEKPKLIIEHRVANATIGGQAMLELQVKGYPKPKVKLSKEGKEIEPSSKYKFLYENEESLSVVIKNVEASDAGKYEFLAENELGQDIREMILNVNAPPKIKTKLEDISIKVDETLKIFVEVEGLPKPTLKFYKDGKEIKSSGRTKIVEESSGSTLIIEKTTLKDSGSYSVVASNEVAQVSQFFNVNVYTKPRVLKKLGTEIIVSQKEEVELSVRIESEPAPEIQWFKDGQEITSDGHYIIKQDGDSYILKITGAVTTDASSYKCRAKNIHGSVDDDVTVHVRCAPKVLKPLEDMTVTEHDKNVTFDVEVEAFPKPNVKWYLDEMEISETRSEFTRIESDNGVKLVIKEVASELSGKYSCKLSNELGETETSARLTVNCKPRIIKHLKDTTVEEGATLHLEVEIEACPEPTVKWLRNGTEVSADARIKISRDSHRQETYNLTVNLIKYEEEGEYEVEVTNSLGTVSSKSYVTVQKTIHTDAVEETEEPPKKLIVEVLEDEEQQVVEEEGIRIEEIIEEEPPDQGRKEAILEDVKVDSKSSILAEREEIEIAHAAEDEEQPLVTKQKSLKKRGKSVNIAEEMVTVEFEQPSQIENTTTPKRKSSRGRALEIEEIEVVESEAPQTPSEVIVEAQLKRAISATKEEIVEDEFKISKRKESKVDILEQAQLQKGIMATKEEALETEGPKRRESRIDVIEGVESRKATVAVKDDIVEVKNDIAKIKRQKSKVEEIDDKVAKAVFASKEEVVEEGDLNKLSRRESRIDSVEKDEPQRAVAATKEKAVDVENEAEKSKRKASKTNIIEEEPQKGTRIVDDEVDEDVEELLRRARKQRSLVEDIKIEEVDEALPALPVITDSTLKDKSQYESLNVVYTVRGKANPPPTATWTLNGQVITSSTPRCSISQKGEEFKLEVKKLKMEDGGSYQCVLSNPVGDAMTQATLHVIPEGEFRRPKVKEGLVDQEIVKKNTATLKAVIIGDPVPDATWYFNGKPITEEQYEKYKIILDTEDREIADDLKECTYSLTIPRTDRENQGKYTIKAKNKWGEAESSAQLTIVLRPEITGPDDVKVVPGNSIELKCVIQANPIPTVIWTRNENLVEETDDIEIIKDVPAETYILRFKNVKLGDEGYYKVTAKNKLGEDSSEGRVRIIKDAEPTTEKPKIITPLADAQVEHGGEVTLMIRANGLPRPQLTWFLNNKPIEDAPELKIVENSESQVSAYLTVTDFNEKDAGYYKVTAVNVVGDDETSAKVSMVQTPPSFSLRLIRNLDVNEGEPLVLKAKITGSPKPVLTWYKDGEEIPKDDDRIKTEVTKEGNVKLQIDEVRPSDSGAYKLVIKNPNGETAGLCAVAVTPSSVRPKFTKCLKDQNLTIGEPLRLEALVTAYPPPEIKWFKDGAPIRPSSNVHIEHHPNGKIALVVDAIKPEHAGKYSVVATNKLGELTGEASVTTERRPTRPDFIERLVPQHVVEGFPVKMEVKVTGYPAPKVMWYRNNVEIIADPQHIKITNLPDGTSALVVDSCNKDDALSYKAVAQNEAGTAESAAPLTVAPSSKQDAPEERPIFLHPLKDVITDEDQQLKIEVPFTGNPIPSVQWTKDGEPIVPSDRILLTCDGRKVGLVIDKAKPSDAGHYSVTITNPFGQDTTDADATVHKVYAPPKFTQRFTDLQQLPSRDGKFLARVSGVPQPDVKWYKDGNLLHDSDKYRIKRDGDICCLYINDSGDNDQGVYKAVASNREGEDACEAKLDVVKEIKTQQKVEAPYFLKRLGDAELFKAMTAKFTACAAGTPEPDVVWFHNDKKLYPSQRIRMEKDTAGLLRLTIAGVDRDDLGKYSCQIFNDYGQDICHAQLRFDETEAKPKRPMIDQYTDYDKYKKSGAPMPLADAPIISRMSDRRLTLSWKPSISPTPRTPVTYQLEMMELPNGDWFTARSGIRGCVCDVGNLEPFRDYRFRIRVENKYGISDPSPYATTHRQKLEPDIPKWVPYLPPGIDFRPETSPYFPKDFDIDRPPHDSMAQAPRFLRREQDVSYGIKDQNTNLFWFVYGYPKPKMEYYFNDEPIESGGRFSTSYTRNGQATLFINKMLDRDVGWYEAVATNEHGQARQRVRLELAEAPVFLRRPDIEYVMMRDKARFQARIIGTPYPEVKWYRDWKPLATSARTKIQFIEPDIHILVINDSILKDEGLYSVSARNVAGTASASAMLHVEENDLEFNIKTYNNPSPIKTRRQLLDSGYDLGDELGRGTQGITYHAVERLNGRNYAAKVMHGRGDPWRPWMHNELDMLNQLQHRKLIRLHDAYETDDTLALILELGGGGELVKDYLLKQDYYTESEIAGYIRQILIGLQYMHEKGIGHMGLNIGDLLLSHPGSDDLKITDFSLSRRISMGRLFPLKYGMPEYVSPECAKGEGVGLPHDMWSVGIITYILLSGMSPFRGERDKETLIRIQEGKWTFDDSWWRNVSVEARDFITKLLIYRAEDRLDVHAALRHPWLERADKIWDDEFRISSRFLRDYFVSYREWYDNASCRNWFRRRPLEGAFTHPSRMVYPPNERYTPPPIVPSAEHTPRKIATWEDQIPSRSPLNYEIGSFKSESHYQSGPDTYLLQLRDVDFPVRIREYMKVAANRGPGAGYIVSDENGFDWSTPVIRERRRFTDIMDEEIDDERKVRISKYGSADTGYSIRRLRHELGSRLDAYAEAEAFLESKHEGRLPFFREKPELAALQEGKDLELTCFAVGEPTPIVQWFKNDAIIAESHRIKIETDSEGRSHIKFAPALSFDVGLYKVVARNKIGQTVVRTRIIVGLVSDEPDSPEATQTSSNEALLTWKQPKFDGHAPVQCYSLQYKKANDTEWTEQADNIDHEFYLMTGLEAGESYVFRLRAKNSIGWSEPGVASTVVVTKPPGAPKIQLSKAMAHLQQITDSGQPPQVDPNSRPNYKLEADPVDWTHENAQNHYEFISEISRGRFSAVVKAIDKRNDTVVVAKIIEQGENKEQVDGEFAAHRSLRHERIASLIAAYRTSDNSVATFILEKLQGVDVLTYLASRHEYTEQTVATIVTQVLDGLQYLHWRGLCHLDLQPDNIVMSGVRSVQAKLVDFGCAHRVTKLGNRVPVVGHPDYMAPEVLAEEPAFPLSDIWSLGVLMYVMLSGTLPFRGQDDNESRQNILFVRYRFENLFQEVTQEGVRFLMLVFKRHPNKRPTAEECHENRWLLPTDYMIKKRERAVFLGNRLKDYNEQYHAQKRGVIQNGTAAAGLTQSTVRSHNTTEELTTAS